MKMFSFQRCLNVKKLIFFNSLSRNLNSTRDNNGSSTTILGIETSCDDTGCAIVNDNQLILAESLYSQKAIHVRYGGVNPVVAHELHRNNIEPAVCDVLKVSNLGFDNIDAIAVTIKPGLLINLTVGVQYANYLAKKFKKSLIPIHHMEAHALVARMYYNIPFPYLVLLISGGHCLLSVVKDVNQFILLGESLDNAPGEVMDKAARRMKLRNIPEFSKLAGGQAIEIAATRAKNPDLFDFPHPLLRHRDCNFSFSGLKDSLIRKLLSKEEEHAISGDGIIPEVNDLCAGFQLVIAEHLVQRTKRAVIYCENSNLIPSGTKNIVVSGGVACNNFIFKAIETLGSEIGYKVYRPPPHICTDNGVMIAWNGVEKYNKQCDIVTNIDLKDVNPKAPLGTNLIREVKAANIPVRVMRLQKLFTQHSS